MIEIKDIGYSADWLHHKYAAMAPYFTGDYEAIHAAIPWQKGEILPYQAAALYILASQFSRPGGRILEIGALKGASAALISRAAIMCIVTTLEPDPLRLRDCQRNLRKWFNAQPVGAYSWDYLTEHATKRGYRYDMIFVDGDHKRVERDMPWWSWVHVGGLMLFHDYTANGAKRQQSQPVVNAVDALGGMLGRAPDVLIVDDEGIGMAGYYRRPSDPDWSAE